MPLPDHLIIYPGHGAGSACGKNMMTETVDTLGNQRRVNYALREDMTKEEFVTEVTDGLLPPPGYFPMNVKMNKEGYAPIDQVLTTGLRGLSVSEFETIANETDALVLDVRSAEDFIEGHIPNSIFIGLDGNFAPWVGELIVDVKQSILLVCLEGREEEAVTRLSRIGFDETVGYLKGGVEAWRRSGKQISQLTSISPNQFESDQRNADVFDVRNMSEYQSEHIVDAVNTPLGSINDHLASFPKNKPFYLHCKGGYRSVIAASILKARGYHDLINIEGGFEAIKETKTPRTEYVCPSTL
jgi:rhodanese-related sulfurtransferase